MYILKRFLSTTPDYYLASTTVLIEDPHLFISVPKPNQAGGAFTIYIYNSYLYAYTYIQ